MPKTFKTTPSADEIAERASRGEDISAYFTNKFTVVRPIRRVNVDLTHGMLRELDQRAARLQHQPTSGYQNLAQSRTRGRAREQITAKEKG